MDIRVNIESQNMMRHGPQADGANNIKLAIRSSLSGL